MDLGQDWRGHLHQEAVVECPAEEGPGSPVARASTGGRIRRSALWDDPGDAVFDGHAAGREPGQDLRVEAVLLNEDAGGQ